MILPHPGCRREVPDPEPRPFPVAVMAMESVTPGAKLSLPGRVESFASEQIAAEVTGRLLFVAEEGTQLVGRFVEDGAVLIEGDVLARIDDTDLQLVLDAAEAELERARTQRDSVAPASLEEAEAELERREIELERVRDAEARNAVAPMEVTAAVTAVRVAKARVDAARAAGVEAATAVRSAEAALAAAQRDLEKCTIRAPFNGLVDDVMLVAGGFAGVGSPVARMVMMDPVRIRVSVSAETARRIEVEDPVLITVDGLAEPLEGKVLQRSVSADIETGTTVITVVARNAYVQEPLMDGVRAIGAVSAALHRDPMDETSAFFVEERRVLRRDDAGWFVWALDAEPINGGREVFRLRRVDVEPSAERINFQGVFIGRFLADAGTLESGMPLAGSPPDDAAEGDRVQVRTGQWRMQPGNLVGVTFVRLMPEPGIYVPVDSVVFDSAGQASVVVVEGDHARHLPVWSFEVVGNQQRIEAIDAEVDLASMSLVIEGMHTLPDGAAVSVIGRGE